MGKKLNIPEFAKDQNGILRKIQPKAFRGKKRCSQWHYFCDALQNINYKKEYNKKNKDIIKLKRKEYKTINADKIKIKNKQYYENNKQQIGIKNKQRNKINPRKIKPLTLQQKQKHKKQSRQRYHKIKNTQQYKEYEQKNKQKKAKYYKEWVSLNRQEINKKSTERIKSNPVLLMASSLRKTINRTFKDFLSKKKNKTNYIMMCDFQSFTLFIESQFADGMSWNNYGKSKFDKSSGILIERRWQLDHRIPLGIVNFEQHKNLGSKQKIEWVQHLCYYFNYQPLWEDENIKKGDKI